MIKISVPATSANLGPGFDTLGLALSLYNKYYFERLDNANDYEFGEMPVQYANNSNLVITSSNHTYKYLNIAPIYYRISTKDPIPSARGLGSSATCIVAGIMAAMKLANKELSKTEIITLATQIEGHPDNVAPAVLGSLVSSINGENVYSFKYNVNKDLLFTVVIPPFKLKTSVAREVLPEKLGYSDIVYSMSRAINIPKALIDGNIDILYELLDDKLHQPYRFGLINKSEIYKEYSVKNKIPFCISGSGSTMLFISKESIKKDLILLNKNYWVMELKIDRYGARFEE